MIFRYWSFAMRRTAVSAFSISSVVALISASSFRSFSLKNSAVPPFVTRFAAKPFRIASRIFFSCSIWPSMFAAAIRPLILALISLNCLPYFFLLSCLYFSRDFSISVCHMDHCIFSSDSSALWRFMFRIMDAISSFSIASNAAPISYTSLIFAISLTCCYSGP